MSLKKMLVKIQAPLQAALRPAERVPLIRNAHREVEEWTTAGVPVADVVTRATNAIEQLQSKGFTLSWSNESTVEAYYVTKRAAWLDYITLEFETKEGEVVCSASASSTGVVPLIIPLAPLWNVLFFWVPFGDNGMCEWELDKIRTEMGIDRKVTKRRSDTNTKKDSQD